MQQDTTYEDQFSPVGRRVRRAWRALRWVVKGVLGGRRRMLIEMRWRLGDEVMALPIYQALGEGYPNTHITVLCNYPDLLADNPYVDAVNVETGPTDRYILLRGTDRGVHRLTDYARRAGVPTPSHRPWLDYSDWSTPLLDDPGNSGGPLVAIAAGATWPPKCWPMERWQALASALAADGCRIVELGTDAEAVGVGVDLTGRTSVRDAACVLHAARLLICSDSGLMHLARAAGTPVLALFGPTDPSILIRDDPEFHVLTNERECCGCWNLSQQMTTPGECPRAIPECLDTITAEAVLARATELLHRER